jgi:hypothetical protein
MLISLVEVLWRVMSGPGRCRETEDRRRRVGLLWADMYDSRRQRKECEWY